MYMAAGNKKTRVTDEVAPTSEKTVLMEGTKMATNRVKHRMRIAIMT